ncbi:MAG TPA: drug/metabolite exporter YedA [Candidatus Kapabacteria bacterium]|nr:drug/metabolite exporter YedA [Candidatus Kapabacteria bacterium]
MKLRLPVVLALLGVYLIWGSTYLAMRFAIESIPPLLMAGSRYVAAGVLLFSFLKWRGHAWPTLRQWRGSAIVGVLLLLGGNGMVGLALEQGVSSGMSALVVGVTPLFALVFARFWGQRASGREWLGIGIGLFGLVLLNFGRELSTSPLGGVLLVLAALSWSFGSIWGKHLDLPSSFMASALQMIVGGVALVLVGLARGEALTDMPSDKALWSLAYLVFFGAILGFSAYAYLLETVRPALATSYAYVNPLVAVALGVWLGGESVDALELVAMAVILAGVVMVYLPVARTPSPHLQPPAPATASQDR